MVLLQRFRELVISYFNDSKYSWQAEGRSESNNAKDARVQINRMLDDVHSTIRISGNSLVVEYTPPPAIGGYIQNIDILINMFKLHQFSIPNNEIIDITDRTIGIYTSNKTPSFIRTINPFFWLALFLDYLVEIPFSLLGKAGFNSKKIEDSTTGRVVKFFLYMVVVFASFLTILELTGYLNVFNVFIRRFISS